MFWALVWVSFSAAKIVSCNNKHYCLTDLSVDSNDITALVSGEQKHYFHLWGLQKPLVKTMFFYSPFTAQ
jgi:hypothetical protein